MDLTQIIIEKYNSGKTQKQIATELNISQTGVSLILRKNKIETRVGKKIKYKINVDFFKNITTEKQAYFLGLLYENSNLESFNFLSSIIIRAFEIDLLFNNVSSYQSTGIQQAQKSITRPWIRVKNDIDNDLYWQYWLDNYTWNGVLVLSTVDLYTSNPTEIYKTRNIKTMSGLSIEIIPLKIKYLKELMETFTEIQSATDRKSTRLNSSHNRSE
jgi:hypothetical protein